MKECTIKEQKMCIKHGIQKKRQIGVRTGPETPKAENPEKRLFSLPYISHNVHYTKRHIIKKRTPSRSLHRCGGPVESFCGSRNSGPPLHALWFSDAAAACSSNRLTSAAVGRFQNTGRSPRSRFSPPFCILLRCQTVPRLLRWSQSTVPPVLPDNLHPPAK